MRKAEVRPDHSELILIRHAKEVEAALAKLPRGALHATRREAIRVNLSLLTDGKVGGVKLSVKDRGAAKRSALKSIKNLARELPKPTATAATTKGDEPAWQQFVRALDWFLTLFGKAFSTSGRASPNGYPGPVQAGTEADVVVALAALEKCNHR